MSPAPPFVASAGQSSQSTIDSAAGLIALLQETEEPELQIYAMQELDSVRVLDQVWPELVDHLSTLEVIYENASFPADSRALVASVLSKVYYHLGSYDDALDFALAAHPRFDPLVQTGEYVETLLARCIDAYIEERQVLSADPAIVAPPEAVKGKTNGATSLNGAFGANGLNGAAKTGQRFQQMERIVEGMLQNCIDHKDYKQAIGLSIETYRFDILERLLTHSGQPQLLSYVLQTIMTVSPSLATRYTVLRLLLKIFGQMEHPDYFALTHCFVHLNDPQLAAELIKKLLSAAAKEKKQPGEKALIAYQVAFDLAETATQDFLGKVRSALGLSTGLTSTQDLAGTAAAPAGDAMAVDSEAAAAASASATVALAGAAAKSDSLMTRIEAILTGEESISLYVEFVTRNNKADLLILRNTKDALEARNSLYHSAVTFSNAFAHAGTTSDQFLRDSLPWLAKASHWSKFSATAALGVIHQGNLSQGMAIVQPYLPSLDGTSTSEYSEGGSLFALGLVHANHGSEVTNFLKDHLKNANQTIQHGAALGLGAACMATGNEDVYDALKDVLYHDDAVAGEAAGYAMGLVMLDTASDKALDEMLQYAHETQHEKIVRGLAVGVSFLMYGKQDLADALIERLMADKDPILRYGGVHTIALAYAGTGNNKAIRKLLHYAVSDVNDDVRRSAVTALGFILFHNPSLVPKVVQLLSESYNPNVRYGATLALGISCAGTGLEEAVDLLEPMTKDPVDFVRQGACIALAMVLIQQNETLNPRVAAVRKIYAKMISDKHEDPMAKFGAALAQGLIDAGGRNMTISMQSRSGSSNMSAIVGMVLFTQFWYWFPMAHFASLSFTPTAIIAVNADLKVPQFELVSNARPSLFAYQPATKPPEKSEVERVATAVLSTTAKATARAKTKEIEKAAADDTMDTNADEAKKAGTTKEDEAMATDEAAAVDSKKAEETTKEKKKKEVEPSSERIQNMSRVLPAQLPYIAFADDSRFEPVRSLVPSGSISKSTHVSAKSAHKKSALPAASAAAAVLAEVALLGGALGGGIIVVSDKRPNEPCEFIDMTAGAPTTAVTEPAAVPAAPTNGAEAAQLNAPIAPMPEPFEYEFDDAQ
ncbi:uncharacterized protein L969DRAFT_86556 [Mixia osmundae IAM 14324]|uniref:26S proteasome regulatory subunit RPN2 n=1 Tax=Mixia osmundae (strain CBS 9802 / IAM 14324 / JCM 22182 / KY 12970) TaxID=764103 RepID=G7E9J8_MIXOS|nr:uncharacterized protein L969DRAFT_86556 [Mixia osmundae IAM 14324]KEI39949.1 hypothetical protein L969DRAFT_86556 [Mixia osmundae IAM 14324]GAA99317.1 hypothetical protein E5Q_06012 [Mixia osmundae IAM 14324]